jgi:hypothetical protein
MDYPSASDSHVIDSDMVLSLSESDKSSLSGNVQEDRGRYCYQLQRFHKDTFTLPTYWSGKRLRRAHT